MTDTNNAQPVKDAALEIAIEKTKESAAATMAQQSAQPVLKPVQEAKPEEKKPVKRILKIKTPYELGMWYLIAGVICCAVAFAGNMFFGQTIDPLLAFGAGMLLVLIVHYFDLINVNGL